MTEVDAAYRASAAAPPAEPSRRGIVACGVYREGCRVQDIAIEQCAGHAGRDGSLVWLGLYEPDDALMRSVQEQFGLHDLLVEDAHQAHQRPKIDVYGEVLFIALRTAHLVDGNIEYGETHLIVGPGFVISIRHGASTSYAPVRRRCEQSPEQLRLGGSFVIYAILDFVADNYFPIIDKITDELEAIEDDIFSPVRRENIERIYRLRAGLLQMRRAVSPMVEICSRLSRHDLPIISAAILPYLNDVQDHILQVNEAIVDLRERLAAAFEASLLLSAARQNEIVKKLASWAAILAVPMAVAGIYGMNFKHVPELEWTFGYPASVALMALICAGLYYLFRRVSWL
jgi:magnesium transporter